MGCRVCRRGELFYLFGFGLAVTAFNYLTFGCLQIGEPSAYGMLILGLGTMIMGAFMKARR
ncbi:MAG: hypothetical protein GXO19_04645 [Epsilonproteobacteria bacterium]|nr:hypothetical protein [Campylobacterota bacterium]NPA57007.1 hypothetical protein [Campylobacterota bacterium]